MLARGITDRVRAWVLAAATAAATTHGVPAAHHPASAQAASLTIAPDYEVLTVDDPIPTTGGQFGGNIQNAGDIDGDGVDDILAPESSVGPDGDGLVRAISGATGGHIYSVEFPDPTGDRAAQFGGMVGSIADFASCPGGSPGTLCPNETVGEADGVPDFVVGAYRANIGDMVDVGRAYVYDGATGALIKRVQMPPDDLAVEASIDPSLRSFPFGRSVISPKSDFPADAPEAVKIGDMDGGGLADIVVGNSSYYEHGPETNPACDPGPCNGAGRVYFFSGEDIAGSDPAVPLDTPFKTVRNPMPRTDNPFYDGFGHTLIHTGDIGGCTVDPGPGAPCPADSKTSSPDGRPDVIVSHIRSDHGDFEDAGRGWLLDGATGAVLRRLDHPQPQTGSLFSYTQAYGGAIGDVAGSLHPDFVLTSPFQDVDFANQGRAWVFNGNHTTSSTGVILGQIDDPQPKHAGFFGIPIAPIGNVGGGPQNEILIGNVGFFGGDASSGNVGRAFIYSPASAEFALTIEDPDQAPGSAFGGGLASLGDVNGDGWVDFAVGAPRRDGSAGLSQGRLYIFRSREAPPDDPTGDDPTGDDSTGDDTTGAGGGGAAAVGSARLAGDNRFETAVAVSRDRFDDRSARAAIVARADDFADALAGGPLAVAVGGPVLLTSSDTLHPATSSELQRVLQPDGVVYLIGGTAAVDAATEQAITSLGYETRRLFGPTRIETAIAISRALGNPETLLLTTGFNFPDALAAGAAAARGKGAVLLTSSDRRHPSLDAYLAERPDAQVFAIGGPAARAYPDATSVFGATRDHTAVEVATRFFDSPEVIGLARRDDFPDALTGSAHIGQLSGPMLLTATAALHEVTAAYLCNNAASIHSAYTYGGAAAVSEQALQLVGNLIDGTGC